MDEKVTITVPSDWLEGISVNQEELRQALKLGLAQLRQQQSEPDEASRVIQALLATGRVGRLPAFLMAGEALDIQRQSPPALPGQPVSEILIAQRRGEL